MTKLFFLFLILFAYPLIVFSQEKKKNDGIFILKDYDEIASQSSAYISNIYTTEVKQESNYVNGAEYEFYFTPGISSPILYLSNGVPGKLYIKGQEFTDLILIYDTYTDKVILCYSEKQNLNRTNYIDLNRELIEGFTLYFEKDTMRFKKMSFNQSDVSGLEDGFFELKYDNKSVLLFKHASKVVYDNSQKTYLYTPLCYAKVNDSFHLIKSKKDLFNLLSNRKTEIKLYYNKLGIKYRKLTSDQLADLLKYYDELNNFP